MGAVKTVRGKSQYTKDIQEDNSYLLGTEKMTMHEKRNLLEELGREDMLDLFEDYTPRQVQHKPKRPPLDQRVSITVTDEEKLALDAEIKAVKRSDPSVTMSQFIRNKATGNIDVIGWEEIAERALTELDEIEKSQSDLRARKRALLVDIENATAKEEEIEYAREVSEIDQKLSRLVALVEKRANRMSGRMTMVEAETIRWRAQRLCISTADYLRFKLFDLTPGSKADAHMSLAGRRRFYISIIDVARNGFGSPPEIVECSQCGVYLDTITKLQEQVRRYESML